MLGVGPICAYTILKRIQAASVNYVEDQNQTRARRPDMKFMKGYTFRVCYLVLARASLRT